MSVDKRKILSVLGKSELLEFGAAFDLEVRPAMKVSDLVDVLARAKRARLDALLPKFTRDRLQEVCKLLGLPVTASNKTELVDRILGRESNQAELPLARPEPVEIPSPTHQAPPRAVEPPRSTQPTQPPRSTQEPQTESPPESDLLSEPTLARPVPPRQPRLIWHGWNDPELTTTVPTQVVEIVRPKLVKDRAGELSGIDSSGRKDKADTNFNRLIWTNDNIVALKTLLEERDDQGGYRYRGKVDLVYIDPPFMVQNDFLAQNSIDIEIDDEEGVLVTKEPSLVEILAYRDTWRQGLDSFLSMLRSRLVLLKEFLAPTGSIYVHLDWHAVHYVKVMMDEIFGYENFINEVIWRSTNAHNDASHLGNVHQTLLHYAAHANRCFAGEDHMPHSAEYIGAYFRYRDEKNRIFMSDNVSAPGGRGPVWNWNGHTKAWRYTPETAARLEREGRIFYTKNGVPRLKRYLDEAEGVSPQSVWDDQSVRYLVSWSDEQLFYPTQKPIGLLERIIRLSCPPNGLVVDCFAGSGTTLEAAERLDRRWIGIDNGKYAVHLSRKRLIQLQSRPRPSGKPAYEYPECEHCKVVRRKEKPSPVRGTFSVRPFTVENMGVYQRAEEWQGFQTQQSSYRDEMIKVFGGEPVTGYRLLHGHKGDSWIHVGPLDGPVSSLQVSDIAREARRTDRRHVTVLSADFDTISADEHRLIAKQFDGMRVTIRVIPAAALDEIRRRIEHQRANPAIAYSSTTIPAFYAPLAIMLRADPPSGRLVRVYLERCEVDIDSFLASQRPALPPITEGMSDARRKKAIAEQARWAKRRKELESWLAKARSWRAFVDFWAIDWNYGERVGQDGKPIFETDWQSFRQKTAKSSGSDELTFVAERSYDEPGRYRIAARVTDVFGNDGIATVEVNVE